MDLMSDATGGDNRVSQTVWPWRNAAARSAAAPTHGNVKGRVLLQASIMAIVAGLFLYHHHPIPGTILLILAGFLLVSGFFIPSFFLGFEKGGRKFGQWVATGVTWLLLVPFYYLCFLPGRIAILLTGKDPLTRQFPSKATTFWVPRPPVKDPSRYGKQF